MVHKRWIAMVAGGVMLIGCDRFKQSSKRPESPSSPAIATAPEADPSITFSANAATDSSARTTTPDEPQPLTMIEGGDPHEFQFPHAHLYINREHQEVVLYSDDPSHAINLNNKSSANSYYISLAEDFEEFLRRLDAHQLDQFVMHPEGSSAEYDDSKLDGISLAPRYHLQVSAAAVRFEMDGPVLRVSIEGSFFKFDTDDPSRPATLVTVNGTVAATMDKE